MVNVHITSLVPMLTTSFSSLIESILNSPMQVAIVIHSLVYQPTSAALLHVLT